MWKAQLIQITMWLSGMKMILTTSSLKKDPLKNVSEFWSYLMSYSIGLLALSEEWGLHATGT